MVSLVAVLGIATLLGLRHATDPDHLVAVTSLLAGERRRSVRRAAQIGVAWGAGHATSLALFGLPFVLVGSELPESVRRGAEVAVGLVICVLALRLLLRWRRGAFHTHEHAHDHGLRHRHLHAHAPEHGHEHGHAHAPRSPAASFAIGLMHGVGGSAGVGVLLLASIGDRTVAAVCLVVFALCTAVSMALLSTAFALALVRGPLRSSFRLVAPVLGTASLLFGAWYAGAAVV